MNKPPTDSAASAPRRRILAFVIVAGLCVLGAVGYALHALRPLQQPNDAASVAERFVEVNALPASAAAPWLLFRSTAIDASHGRIGFVSTGGHDNTRRIGPLQCDRVHYAAGHGVCLQAQRGVLTTYRALLFDERFKVLHSLALAGPPSRARVSPDGRLAAFTVFISGHAYSTPGFTTRTSIVDMRTGAYVAEDLEALTVMRDGAVFKSADFNFWGVSFTHDGQRFYATLGTDGKTFLVQGDLAARRLRVIHDDVECPSLSPDGTHIAFKRRQAQDANGRFIWTPHVLELASGKVVALNAESRNVDDQLEWLNPSHVLYGMPADATTGPAQTDVWVLAIDASSAPRLQLRAAVSPAVMR